MKKQAKKEGSAILLVLVMAMIITILGSTLTTAIAYTTKQNTNNKNIEDLTYAAESGLEYAITRLRAKEITVSNEATPTAVNFPNTIFDRFDITVDVSIVKSGDKYKVISTATNRNGKSKTVNATITAESKFQASDNKVFRYSLCAEKINVECSGPLDKEVTRWNAIDKLNSKIVMNTNVTPENVTVNIEDKKFILPQFNFREAQRVPEDPTKSITDIKQLEGMVGVEAIPYKRNITDEDPYVTIYLVNLKEGGELHLSAGTMNNAVIITNGKVKYDNGSGGYQVAFLNHSTILAKELEFKISSFNSAYTLIDNATPAFDKLNLTDVSKIDDIIGNYCTNWNNSTGTVVDGEYELGDFEYN